MAIIEKSKDITDVQLQEKQLSKIMGKEKVIWEPGNIIIPETDPDTVYTLVNAALLTGDTNKLTYRLEYFDNTKDTFEIKSDTNDYFDYSLSANLLTIIGKKATTSNLPIKIWQRDSSGKLTNMWQAYVQVFEPIGYCNRTVGAVNKTLAMPRLQMPNGSPLTYDITTDTLVEYTTPKKAVACGFPEKYSYYIKYDSANNILKIRYNGNHPIITYDPKWSGSDKYENVYNWFYIPLTSEETDQCVLRRYYDSGINAGQLSTTYFGNLAQSYVTGQYLQVGYDNSDPYRDIDAPGDGVSTSNWSLNAEWMNGGTDNILSTGTRYLSNSYWTYGLYYNDKRGGGSYGPVTSSSRSYFNARDFMRMKCSDFNTPWFHRQQYVITRAGRSDRSRPLTIDLYWNTSDKYANNANGRKLNTIANNKSYIYPSNYKKLWDIG